MKSSALAVANYEVYDAGGKLMGPLANYVDTSANAPITDGKWVNAIEKNTVEFTLDKNPAKAKLLAGKTYKVKLTTNLETDANQTLSKDNLVLSITTPSLSEAAPKVSVARVIDATHIGLVFDKAVTNVTAAQLNNLVEVTTSTGKKINTTGITAAAGATDNEVVLTLVPSVTPDDNLDRGTTYNVAIPANIVANGVFPNAVNAATTSIKSTAQTNTAIKSVSAQLVANDKVDTQADLVLTFDQRPELATLAAGDIKIFDGADEYAAGGTAPVIKYLGSDSTGRTVVIEGVNAAGVYQFGAPAKDFTPVSGKTYSVEVAAGSVRVDAFTGAGTGALNPSKLTATINGVAVSAPVVDRVTLQSADQMVIDFKENIYSSVDVNKIVVDGFEADQNKFYSPKQLTGSTNFTASVSGKTLTLTAKPGVKFATGTEVAGATGKVVEFKAGAVVSAASAKSIAATAVAHAPIAAGKIGSVKVVDNAAPVLLFGTQGGDPTKEVEYTFSENITLTGTVAPQFKVGGTAEKSSVGTTAVAGGALNTLLVTYTDAYYDAANSTSLLGVTTVYGTGSTNYINDASGNKVASTTLNGVK